MYCSKCGHQIIEGARFCNKCGKPVWDETMKVETISDSQNQSNVQINEERLRNERIIDSNVKNQNIIKESKKGITTLIISIIIVAVLLLASFVLLLLLLPNSQRDKGSNEIVPSAAYNDASISDFADETEANEEQESTSSILSIETETVDASAQIKNATYFSGASASSSLPNEGGYNYKASNVLSWNSSCWCEGAKGYGEGEWIKLDLPEIQRLSGLTIINGYAGTERQYSYNGKLSDIVIEFSNGQSVKAKLNVFSTAERQTIQTISFSTPVETSYVKITIKSVKKGDCADTCLTYVAPF